MSEQEEKSVSEIKENKISEFDGQPKLAQRKSKVSSVSLPQSQQPPSTSIKIDISEPKAESQSQKQQLQPKKKVEFNPNILPSTSPSQLKPSLAYRHKSIRHMNQSEFEIPQDLKNYATPQIPSNRATVGQLLFGVRDPREEVIGVQKTKLAELFEEKVQDKQEGFDESDISCSSEDESEIQIQNVDQDVDQISSDTEVRRKKSTDTKFTKSLDTKISENQKQFHKFAFQKKRSDTTTFPLEQVDTSKKSEQDEISTEGPHIKKLGVVSGVILRCLFNIFGVIMYLQLPTVFGKAGGGFGTLIVLLSTLITFLTALSLSAIVTNGRVKSGGTYMVISRALGPEFGGPIGILFFVANSVSTAMYLIGFSQAIKVIASFEFVWSIQTIAQCALIFIVLFCLVGVRYVSKVQAFVAFPFLIISLLAIVFGFVRQSAVTVRPSVFSGFSSIVILSNLRVNPGFSTFQRQFSIFFPGATGIMAGANISGQLKDPAKSIPKGTITAILISSTTYLILGQLLIGSVHNDFLSADNPKSIILAEVSLQVWLVYLGIITSTISQAITSFTSAPELLKTVANDDLYPFLKYFKTDVTCFIATVVIAGLCILPGQLETIAPLITAFFILTYAFINFACFMKSITKTPGQRPSFRFYHPLIALFASISCVSLMFILDYIFALAASALALIFGILIVILRPNVNQGGAFRSIRYQRALSSLKLLDSTLGHAKNYRLQILILCGENRPHLENFGNVLLKKGQGVLIFGNVIVHNMSDLDSPERIEEIFRERAIQREQHALSKISRGFGQVIVSPSLGDGIRSLIQVGGLSRLSPEVVVFGFKKNQNECTETEVDSYVNNIRDSFLFHNGVMILRGFENFDYFKPVYSGRIDVQQLIDDGGLTLLVPYIITLRKKWNKNVRLRVMEVSVSSAISKEKISMANLLARFRIEADTFPVYLDIDGASDPNKIFSGKEEINMTENNESLISLYDEFSRLLNLSPEETRDRLEDKRTLRHLQVAQHIRRLSADAQLVFISTPIPDIKLESKIYMAQLDCMSRGMPPTVLIRGNQESVLNQEI